MAKTISEREQRNDSGAIMRRAEQGESFTVARHENASRGIHHSLTLVTVE